MNKMFSHDGELKDKIIRIAKEVYKVLGPDFLEWVYEEVMADKFIIADLKFLNPLELKKRYKGNIPEDIWETNFLVEEEVMVEIKATSEDIETDEKQVFNYLKPIGVKMFLLINFGKERLEWEYITLETSEVWAKNYNLYETTGEHRWTQIKDFFIRENVIANS